MAKLWQKKAVLVSVYEEKPTKRKAISSNNHHHHHHHHYYVHHSIKQDNKHGDTAGNKGYNRRAELLSYSQRLRDSVRRTESSQLDTKPISSNIHQPISNAVAVEKKPKGNKTTPSCFGNWKILNLKFCRSLTSIQVKKGNKKKKHTGSTRNAMQAVMKSIQLQMKRGFFSKLLQKHK